MRNKLERMIEICEQQESYERKIDSLEWSLNFGFQGTFPELKRKLEHRVNMYNIYIEFLTEKINRLKLEL